MTSILGGKTPDDPDERRHDDTPIDDDDKEEDSRTEELGSWSLSDGLI